MTEFTRRLAESRRFQHGVIALVFLSAILVGLEGIPEVQRTAGRWLNGAERVVLALFTLEILLRIIAHGLRPWRFFANGWNLLDFGVTALCFLPATHFVVVLRLVRSLRVLRLLAPLHESEVIRRMNEELAAAYRALAEEKERSERLLLNVLPLLIAERLKRGSGIIADRYEEAAVLFADLVGFTELSRSIPPERVVSLLDEVFSRFDQLAGQFRVEKIKTIGDAYMVVAGVPEPRADALEALVEMALAMQAEIPSYPGIDGRPLALRIGIHCGPVVAGVIGRKKFIYDLWGDTVNTASRMESQGLPGKIQITEATAARLASRFVCEPRGTIQVRGKGPMTTFFVVGAIPGSRPADR